MTPNTTPSLSKVSAPWRSGSPAPLISGLYTCKAISVLGEASVACQLEVKGKVMRRVLPRTGEEEKPPPLLLG